MDIKTTLKRITVEPIVFLYMWSSFQQFPTNQALIYSKVCTIKYDNHTVCDDLYSKRYEAEDDFVQSEASKWIMYNNIAQTVPSIFSVTFFLGPYGDTLGRKLPLMVPIIGCLVYNVANLVNAHYMRSPMWCLLFGNVVSGVTGGYIAVMMASYSYIGHITTQGDRTFRVAILEAMIFFAGTLGVFFSGAMLDNTSYDFVFGFIICLLSTALIYAALRIDNLSPVDANDARISHCKRFLDSTRLTIGCLRRNRSSRTKLYVCLLVVVLVILQLCTTGEGDIMYLYVKRPVFDWSSATYGYFRGLENFTRGLAVLTILPICTHKLNWKDTSLILCGLASKLFGLVIIANATTTWLMFLAPVVDVLQGFPSAAIRSSSSKLVEQNEQGTLFGVIATAENVAAFCSTLIFNNLYPATLDIFPGLCFMFAAFLTVACMAIILYIHGSVTSSSTVYRRIIEEGVTTNDTEDSTADR